MGGCGSTGAREEPFERLDNDNEHFDGPTVDGSEPWTWLTECLVPCAASVPLFCCTSSLEKRTANYTALATYNLQHRGSCTSSFLDVYLYFYDIVYDFHVEDPRQLLYSRRSRYGGSFVAMNKVVIADAEEVNARLLGPMDRGDYLGLNNFRSSTLRRAEDGGPLMPLTLPSGACPGNDGRHAAFRTQMYRYVLNDAQRERSMASNPVTARLLAKVAKEWRASAELQARARGDGDLEAEEKAFHAFCYGPLPDFNLRMLHWACFGLDLGSVGSVEYQALWQAFYEPKGRGGFGLMYWVWGGSVTSYLFRFLPRLANALRSREGVGRLPTSPTVNPGDVIVRDYFDRVAPIYGSSPALAGYSVDPSLAKCPSKAEFVEQVLTIMCIAALQGPLLLQELMLSPKGPVPRDFALPLDNTARLRLCILEAMRLSPPVFETTMVASDVEVLPNFANSGTARVFPKGCPMALNFVCSNTDPRRWGDTAHKFDPYGHAELLWGPKAVFNGFNSVGDRGDRICPGRGLTLNLMMDFLRAVHGPVKAGQDLVA